MPELRNVLDIMAVDVIALQAKQRAQTQKLSALRASLASGTAVRLSDLDALVADAHAIEAAIGPVATHVDKAKGLSTK
jgi:hypothetical protein